VRLLVFSPYFPPHVGGLEGYVRDLNDEIVHLGLAEAITVFTPRLPREGLRREERALGYRVVRHPAFELIPNFPCPSIWRPDFWRASRVALRPSQHDIVVSHTRFFLSSASALAYSRATGVPLVHVEHGSDFVHLGSAAHSRAARAYDLTLGRLVLRHAQAVVAVSQAAADFVKELAGREAQVIYRGVDQERYDRVQPSRELPAIAAGRQTVTFVGRLIDGKGVADLVEAFARLREPDVLLCIVGDGPRRSDLESLARLRGLGDRCVFLGYREEADALALIRASDVVVNPSYTEGLPTSVLEAAMLGRAVLASDVGGTSEIVADGHGGLLFKPHDIDGLRLRLEQLLLDGELRGRLGNAAHDQAVRRFDRRLGATRFAEVARGLVRPGDGAVDQALSAGDASSTCSKADS
jgi:glycosyltransferase involved in cell wall biosynthesis